MDLFGNEETRPAESKPLRWSRTRYHGKERCDLCMATVAKTWLNGRVYVPARLAVYRWAYGEKEVLVCEDHDLIFQRRRKNDKKDAA